MNVIPVFRDYRPPFLADRTDLSLLVTPLGASSLLAALRDAACDHQKQAPIIVMDGAISDGYQRRVQAICRDATALATHEFGEWLDAQEPSDLLLIVDSQHFPVRGFHFERLLRLDDAFQTVRHLVPLHGAGRGTRESVVLDADHRVRRVQRFYDGVTQLETSGVAASAVSVAAMRLIHHRSLPNAVRLRTALASRGIPTRDLPLSVGMLDLAEPHNVLLLSERLLRQSLEAPPPGFERVGDAALVHESAQIDASVRLQGPVAVHPDAVVAPGATLIGPVVVGSASRVRRGTLLAQSLLLPNAETARESTIRHAVIAGLPGDRAPAALDATPSFLNPLMATAEFADRSDGSGETVYPRIKRYVEGGIAAVALLLLAPVMLIVALLVRLTSPGDVFFGHEREGRAGRVFRCYKFRTMVANAHALQRKLYKESKVDGPQFKIDRDPRVTTIGRILRATNVDELPQLWNVVRGEMSLIGPRPSPFRENQICVPWRQARLSVRPGITGLWQICRHERAAGDFHQWIYYDMLYVRHQTFWLDVKILLATVLTLGGRFSVPLSTMIPMRKIRPASATPGIPGVVPCLFTAKRYAAADPSADTAIRAS